MGTSSCNSTYLWKTWVGAMETQSLSSRQANVGHSVDSDASPFSPTFKANPSVCTLDLFSSSLKLWSMVSLLPLLIFMVINFYHSNTHNIIPTCPTSPKKRKSLEVNWKFVISNFQRTLESIKWHAGTPKRMKLLSSTLSHNWSRWKSKHVKKKSQEMF